MLPDSLTSAANRAVLLNSCVFFPLKMFTFFCVSCQKEPKARLASTSVAAGVLVEHSLAFPKQTPTEVEAKHHLQLNASE